jgi:hypothetical protein
MAAVVALAKPREPESMRGFLGVALSRALARDHLHFLPLAVDALAAEHHNHDDGDDEAYRLPSRWHCATSTRRRRNRPRSPRRNP